MRLKCILQHDETDCGAACLSMVLDYYGKSVPIRKIREEACTDTKGTSGFGMVKAAQKYGLSCKAFIADEKEKIKKLPCATVLHIKHKGMEHYVVLKKVNRNKVYLCDPGVGNTVVSFEDFFQQWTGVFFILTPDTSFEKSSHENVLFRFLTLLKQYKKNVAQILTASLFLSAFGIFVSFYFRFLIDEVLYIQIKSTLNLCSLCYLIVIVFQAIIGFCRNEIILFMGTKIDVMLSSDFFYHLLRLPMKFFTSRKTGEVLSRLNDVNVIKNAISSATLSVVIDSIMIVTGAAFLIKMGGRLLLVAIVPIIISSIIVYLFKDHFKRQIRNQAIITAEKNAFMYESLNGIATVKGLSTEQKAFDKCENLIVETGERTLDLGKLGNRQRAILEIISSLGTLAIYWYGSFLIFDGTITLGQLISFTMLSGFFLSPLSRLLTMQSYWQEVFVSSERLLDIIDLEEEAKDEDSKMDAESLAGDIEFCDVSFAYGNRGKTIKNMSFLIPGGKKVAFVGQSGSGKTTLLKLLMRFYDLNEGKILINGVDINDYKTKEYRKCIGYVPQESLLFSGTILQNITWAAVNYTKEDIIACTKKAQAFEFIQNLPEKFATIVGEQGATLSGGERQRIALARILLCNPELIILDEATASLDSISETKIMDAVFSSGEGKTTIIVAHRLSTIKDCDLIYVFDKGELVEQGNHKELLEKNGKYSSLWRAQNEKSFSS
jgi:ATP-binding cassette subfamily B protein